jgi:hypothetical protein
MYIIIFIIKLINLIIIFIDAMIKISLRLFSTNPKICITSKWKPLAQESWQRPCYSIKYKVFMFFSRNGNFQPLCLKKKEERRMSRNWTNNWETNFFFTNDRMPHHIKVHFFWLSSSVTNLGVNSNIKWFQSSSDHSCGDWIVIFPIKCHIKVNIVFFLQKVNIVNTLLYVFLTKFGL